MPWFGQRHFVDDFPVENRNLEFLYIVPEQNVFGQVQMPARLNVVTGSSKLEEMDAAFAHEHSKPKIRKSKSDSKYKSYTQ